MNAKYKYVTSKKKYRTNLVIANPKPQEITQGKDTIPNIKHRNNFSTKNSDRNSILWPCGAHSHEPVQVEMTEGEVGNLLPCQPELLIFLNKKFDQSKVIKNIGGFTQNGVAVTHRTATNTDTNY